MLEDSLIIREGSVSSSSNTTNVKECQALLVFTATYESIYLSLPLNSPFETQKYIQSKY